MQASSAQRARLSPNNSRVNAVMQSGVATKRSVGRGAVEASLDQLPRPETLRLPQFRAKDWGVQRCVRIVSDDPANVVSGAVEERYRGRAAL